MSPVRAAGADRRPPPRLPGRRNPGGPPAPPRPLPTAPRSRIIDLLAGRRLHRPLRRSQLQLIPGVGPAVPVLIAHVLRRGREMTVAVTTPFPYAMHQQDRVTELVRQWNRSATWVRFEVEHGPGTMSVTTHIDARSPGWDPSRRARRRRIQAIELHAASTDAWRWMVDREVPLHALEATWSLAARQVAQRPPER